MYLEYKGPQIDFNGPTQMFNTWMHDYASDWSVRVKMAEGDNVQSGFQLIVEEMDNLELRQMRSRMFERSLKDLSMKAIQVWDVAHPGSFTNVMPFVTIPEPVLPINMREQEEVWSMKIDEGRATRVDYFMKVEGLSKEEAEARVKEIDEAGDNQPTPPTFLNEL